MEKHYVRVNEKVTTWLEHTFQVAANSEDEAINKIIDCYKRGDDPFCEKEIYIVDSQEMVECETPISIKENDGFSTIEVLKNKKVIWENGNK